MLRRTQPDMTAKLEALTVEASLDTISKLDCLNLDCDKIFDIIQVMLTQNK